MNLLATRAPVADAGVGVVARPGLRTDGQSRAYHGKCGALARLRDAPPHEIKKAVLEEASRMFGREIESSKALSEAEMSDVLDFLDAAIAEASDE